MASQFYSPSIISLLTLSLPSADDLCKQVGPRYSVWPNLDLNCTLIVLLKNFLKKLFLKKKSADDNKSMNSMQRTIVNDDRGQIYMYPWTLLSRKTMPHCNMETKLYQKP